MYLCLLSITWSARLQVLSFSKAPQGTKILEQLVVLSSKDKPVQTSKQQSTRTSMTASCTRGSNCTPVSEISCTPHALQISLDGRWR